GHEPQQRPQHQHTQHEPAENDVLIRPRSQGLLLRQPLAPSSSEHGHTSYARWRAIVLTIVCADQHTPERQRATGPKAGLCAARRKRASLEVERDRTLFLRRDGATPRTG